jgi:DNA-binding transcriptional MerR regulator
MRQPGPDPNYRERAFASRDVCLLARITARQLQWWDERNVASPHQKDQRRVYAAEDVIAIMLIAELSRKGFSLQKIRQLVRPLRREILRNHGRLFHGEVPLFFLTDGKSVYLEPLPGRVIELLRESSRPMFLVSVSDQAKLLAEFRETPDGRRRRRSAENQLTLF